MNNKKNRSFGGVSALILIVLIFLVFWITNQSQQRSRMFTLDEYHESVDSNQVESAVIYQDKAVPTGQVELKLKDSGEYRYVNVSNVQNEQEYLEDAGVRCELDKVPGENVFLTSILPTIIMVAAILFIFVFMRRQSGISDGGAGAKAMSFGKSRARMSTDKDKKVTFDDVAGLKEEKEELEEIVDFLKNPQRYIQVGARIPKGVLLEGPPGTGKTLLAKAVAGEADVPFFTISGSDFVEMFVGVGASRVRDLFEDAKKNSPCIIFIDEIDAVARRRGTGMGGGHDEREQTLNQLLVEMDGFGTNSGIIVMAATNRPDVLDPALLRPGRFDRQITVNRPDAQGREDILKVHSRNKPLGPDVDLKEVAKDTIGFTGADLENLLNEAALLAVRRKKKALTMAEINDASSRVQMGTEKKSHKYSKKAKRLTAYHEAGHAVAAYYVEGHDPVKEISIIPRGLGAGGYTWYTPQEENYNSKKEMLDDLISMLGGRVAEALALGDISTGASNDLQRATQICRDMVAKYGMSEVLGPAVFSDENDEVFLGKDFGHVNNYSEATSAKIDAEIERMMRHAYSQTEEILKTHYEKLELVAETLLQKEKLTGEMFAQLMENGKLDEPEAQPTEEPEAPAAETQTAADTAPEPAQEGGDAPAAEAANAPADPAPEAPKSDR